MLHVFPYGFLAPMTEHTDGHFTRHRLEGPRSLLSAAIPADDWQDFPGDITGTLRGRKKNVSRRDLLRLRGPLHWSIGTELADIFRLFVGWIERRPHRSRRHGIHADTARNQVRRKRPCESMNAALGHRIV